MAIDQREALIAAVRAQVEKEKAAKAAKLKKEQEAMQLSGAADAGEAAADHNKPKYKTLSKRRSVVRKLQNLVLNWRTRNQKRYLQRQQNLRRKSQRRQVMKDLA